MSMRETTLTKRRSFSLPVSSIVRANLAVALAAVLFVVAAPKETLAQSTTKTRTQDNNFSRAVTDPCNNDTAVMNGHQTVQFQTQDTPGAFHVKLQIHEQGNGTSTATGIQYQYQLMNSLFAFDSSTSTFSVTFSTKSHVIGNGTQNGDNFFLNTFDKAAFNKGQGAFTIDHTNTSCK